MLRFNSTRAKDPVLAAIISMGLIFGAPAMTRANPGSSYGEWEEVGPAGQSAQQQLLTAPPRVAAAPLGQSDFRPPVEPPKDMSGVKTLAAANQNAYVVQAGDTLPKIAMKVYGDPNRWQDLMVINNIENGNRIFVGQRLIISSEDSSVAGYELPEPVRVEREPTQVSSVADFDDNQHDYDEYEEPSISADAVDANASYYGQTGGSYTIQRGDTLGAISKRILGSSQRWREIADANPGLNPQRLNVGQTIVIPGAQPTGRGMTPPTVMPVVSRPLAAPPQNRSVAAASQPNFSTPSYEPPPLMAPPPPIHQPAAQRYSGSSGFAPPPAPPMYSGGMQPPPPPPAATSPSFSPPPPSVSGGFAPPPPPPYMSSPSPSPEPAPGPGMPVAVSTRELYREERYRIPNELKPTNFSPYFANFNGYHGLFEVESALLPYLPTWHFGLHYRYEKYQYFNGEKNVIEGTEHMVPLHLAYTGKKLFAGVTVPFQNWEVSRSGIANDVTLSGLHDPSLKVGYQVWKNLEGTHAVTLHTEGKFSTDNHHQPLADMSGKTRIGSRIGPAEATRGSWGQVGAAYSGVMNDRWASHLNLALANNSTDSITKMIIRGGMDYRVNNNFTIASEINSTSYDMDNATSGTNVDMMLGFILFNDRWQGSVAFDMALQKDWGYAHDFGVVFGLNHRWD